MQEKKSTIKRICEYFFSGAIIALLLLLLLWFLYYFKIVPMPEAVTRIFGQKTQDVDSSYYDESRLWKYLAENRSEDLEINYITLDINNAGDFITALNTRSDYYWNAQTEIFYNGNKSATTFNVWANDQTVRVDAVSEFKNTTSVLQDGTTVVRNNLTGESRTAVGDNDQILENVITVADVEYYIESDESVIREARLVEDGKEEYLYINFFTEKLNKVDEFYISLDYGIVLYAMSEIASEVVFTQTTVDFQPGNKAGRETFKI